MDAKSVQLILKQFENETDRGSRIVPIAHQPTVDQRSACDSNRDRGRGAETTSTFQRSDMRSPSRHQGSSFRSSGYRELSYSDFRGVDKYQRRESRHPYSPPGSYDYDRDQRPSNSSYRHSYDSHYRAPPATPQSSYSRYSPPSNFRPSPRSARYGGAMGWVRPGFAPQSISFKSPSKPTFPIYKENKIHKDIASAISELEEDKSCIAKHEVMCGNLDIKDASKFSLTGGKENQNPLQSKDESDVEKSLTQHLELDNDMNPAKGLEGKTETLQKSEHPPTQAMELDNPQTSLSPPPSHQSSYVKTFVSLDSWAPIFKEEAAAVKRDALQFTTTVMDAEEINVNSKVTVTDEISTDECVARDPHRGEVSILMEISEPVKEPALDIINSEIEPNLAQESEVVPTEAIKTSVNETATHSAEAVIPKQKTLHVEIMSDIEDPDYEYTSDYSIRSDNGISKPDSRQKRDYAQLTQSKSACNTGTMKKVIEVTDSETDGETQSLRKEAPVENSMATHANFLVNLSNEVRKSLLKDKPPFSPPQPISSNNHSFLQFSLSQEQSQVSGPRMMEKIVEGSNKQRRISAASSVSVSEEASSSHLPCLFTSCKTLLPTAAAQKIHMRREHNANIDGQALFNCRFKDCGSQFVAERNRAKHEVSHGTAFANSIAARRPDTPLSPKTPKRPLEISEVSSEPLRERKGAVPPAPTAAMYYKSTAHQPMPRLRESSALPLGLADTQIPLRTPINFGSQSDQLPNLTPEVVARIVSNTPSTSHLIAGVDRMNHNFDALSRLLLKHLEQNSHQIMVLHQKVDQIYKVLNFVGGKNDLLHRALKDEVMELSKEISAVQENVPLSQMKAQFRPH